jgi:superoxide dismutase, Cu-Zn family
MIRGGTMTTRGILGLCLAGATAASVPAWLLAGSVAAQHAQHAPRAAPVATAPRQRTEASPLDGLRESFDEIFVNALPAWKRPGPKQAAMMFDEFLAWPRNPFEVQLTVRFTSSNGVGPALGTLTVKNTEIMVAGRKEPALFITPSLKGLERGLYAFHVHENPDCGPAVKDGENVPGLGAGGHLWLSGTGVMSGTTFTSHLGDLADLEVDASGAARKLVVAARLTLADVANRSFMIHATQDDTSARLACAVFN